MSTRAALLPTVAHAFSSSLYARTKSPSLNAKLSTLFAQRGPPGSDLVDDHNDVTQPSAAATRFEAASAQLWGFLQHKIPRKHVTPKLSRLTARPSDVADGDEHEDIFASQMRDDCEEDEVEEMLFDRQQCHDDWSSKGEDLFGTFERCENASTPDLPSETAMFSENQDLLGTGRMSNSSSSFFYSDEAMMVDLDDADDDLLLDLKLDERISDE